MAEKAYVDAMKQKYEIYYNPEFSTGLNVELKYPTKMSDLELQKWAEFQLYRVAKNRDPWFYDFIATWIGNKPMALIDNDYHPGANDENPFFGAEEAMARYIASFKSGLRHFVLNRGKSEDDYAVIYYKSENWVDATILYLYENGHLGDKIFETLQFNQDITYGILLGYNFYSMIDYAVENPWYFLSAAYKLIPEYKEFIDAEHPGKENENHGYNFTTDDIKTIYSGYYKLIKKKYPEFLKEYTQILGIIDQLRGIVAKNDMLKAVAYGLDSSFVLDV